MSVVEAVEAYLAAVPEVAGVPEAATALALAAELDDSENSATSKSMCARALNETLDKLRALAPAQDEQEDEIERARKRRAERLARQSASGAAPPS